MTRVVWGFASFPGLGLAVLLCFYFPAICLPLALLEISNEWCGVVCLRQTNEEADAEDY
jgi:hypothetical protein